MTGKARAHAHATTLVVDHLTVSLTRKRVRNINLRVRRDGTVGVSAPPGVPEQEVRAFVRSKSAWIERARDRALSRKRMASPSCSDGAELSLWGGPVTVRLATRPPSGPRPLMDVELDGSTLLVNVDERIGGGGTDALASRDRQLAAWLGSQLEAEVGRLLPACQDRVGRRCSRLTIRTMKTRWGSCNVRSGRVTLNAALVHHDPRCTEYVLVHELCHLPDRAEPQRALPQPDGSPLPRLARDPQAAGRQLAPRPAHTASRPRFVGPKTGAARTQLGPTAPWGRGGCRQYTMPMASRTSARVCSAISLARRLPSCSTSRT